MAHLRRQERSRYIARMFARISRRYDLLNTVMTAGRHYAWRRIASAIAVGRMVGPVLDVATGTGDFAFALLSNPGVTRVIGLDYTREMLELAARKAQRKELALGLTLIEGDAHALPFPDNYFICATVGFGIRNFSDVPLALKEMARVVRPGGRVAVLEIVKIESKGAARWLFPIYFRYVTPWIGALLAGDREAYTYLPNSVQTFCSARELSSIMEQAGLKNLTCRRLAMGSVTIHVGEKEKVC